jgi:hypothetical protein
VQHDVHIARVRADGVLATGPFAIDIAADDAAAPAVSSLTDGSGERHLLVAYQTNRTGNLDIYLRVFRSGTTPALVAEGLLGDLEKRQRLRRADDRLRRPRHLVCARQPDPGAGACPCLRPQRPHRHAAAGGRRPLARAGVVPARTVRAGRHADPCCCRRRPMRCSSPATLT